MALSENPTVEEIVDEIERLNNLIIDRGGARTITPSTTNQILEKGNYKGDITVLGDVDLVASNIRSGKNIFNVVGNLEPIPNLNPSATWSTLKALAKEYRFPTTSGSKLTVPILSLNNSKITAINLTTSDTNGQAMIMWDFASRTSRTYLNINFNTGEVATITYGGNSYASGNCYLGTDIIIRQIGNYIVCSYGNQYGGTSYFKTYMQFIKLNNKNSKLGQSSIVLYTEKHEGNFGTGITPNSSSHTLAYKYMIE